MAVLRLSLAATAVAAALLVALALAPAALGADPTPTATAAAMRPPTCAERFPAEGPAGVDLRLGCIVGEVVGGYSTAATAAPTPLSSYAIGLGLVVAGALLLVWVAGRLLGRAAGRRLAPVLPNKWWVCASCKSVNGGGVSRCYSCGSARPDGPSLTTDDQPATPQSFGSTRKRG